MFIHFSSFLKNSILWTLCLFFSPTLFAQNNDAFLVKKVVRGFKYYLGDRGEKLYDDQYFQEAKDQEAQIRTWYRIPRNEFILAAYDEIKYFNITSDYFAEGAVFTDKRMYVRVKEVWSVAYIDFLYHNVSVTWDDDYLIVYRNGDKYLLPVHDSDITPAEMVKFLQDIANQVNADDLAMLRDQEQAKLEAEIERKRQEQIAQEAAKEEQRRLEAERERLRQIEIAKAEKERKRQQRLAEEERRKEQEIRERIAEQKHQAKLRAQQKIIAELNQANDLFARGSYYRSFKIFFRHRNSPYFTAEGQYMLGYMYHKGEGIKKDKKEAAYWYKKAKKNGYDLPDYALKLIRKKG